jgi:phenylacetate-CoA ligase
VRSLPIVSKAMLMDHFEEWVTDPRLRLSEVEAHLEEVHGDELHLDCYRCMPTGGTTGRKGVFVYDRDEWRQCLTAFLRWSELTGLRPRLGRRVRLATVTATSPLHMTARFSLSIDLGLYAGCRLDARTPIRELVTALNEHRPEHLVAYASMASLLAVEQLESRLHIAPRVVVTTSEVRTEEMTANIHAAWGSSRSTRTARRRASTPATASTIRGCTCSRTLA